MPKTILTGIKSNSTLTLGNYLGAILPMLKIQETLEPTDQFFLFIPDLHSITTPVDYKKLYQTTLNTIKIILASGIDPTKKNICLYRQSQIPAHSEMNWALSCFTYYGETQRMIQFKEKSLQQGKNVTVGLFTYPILMAGDILLYNADYVPLGADQKQHLELTRTLATRINNKFDQKIFTVPKPWQEQLDFMNLDEAVKIRSLSNPEKKMSKSISDPKGTITFEDTPAEAIKKVMSAQTDSLGKIKWDWQNQPGITNLLQILGLLTNTSTEQIKKDWENQNRYGELKKAVAEKVGDFLTNFQQKLNNISDTQAEEIAKKGETTANLIAKDTLFKLQKVIGLKNH